MDCTYDDKCTAQGTCAGTTLTCMSDDLATRTCNGTASCTVVPKPGAACDDGDLCTRGDVRRADGTCAGMPYTCAVNECLVSAACDGMGGCKAVAKPDGTSCDADASKCTPNDRCQGGACVPDKPVACVAKDCNTVSCNAGTGNCEYAPTSGGACGTTGCSEMGTCNSGVCSGKPKDCSAMEGPCAVGVCDATTGDCVSAPKPNGTSCSTGGRCGASAVCTFGMCELAPATCPPPSAACKMAVCDAMTGACSERNRPAGTACDPKNSCMGEASCDAQGNCIGTPAPNGEPCTGAGGAIGRCVASSCVLTGGSTPPITPQDSGATAFIDAGAGADSGNGNGNGNGSGSGTKNNKGSDPGCNCGVGGGGTGAWLALALCALVLLATRRRRPD
jgi:MYXO-CTERM domain-containing protein